MKRSIDAELTLSADGQTVIGRFVPYGEVATVDDEDGHGPYREMFLPGALQRACQYAAKRGNAAWIRLDLDHSGSLSNRIGYAHSIEERDDGGWAEFRLYGGRELEKVQDMLRSSHTGLSIDFDDVVAPTRSPDDVVCRRQVSPNAVAATPAPCYAGAAISAIRSSDLLLGGTPELDELDAWLASQAWAQPTT